MEVMFRTRETLLETSSSGLRASTASWINLRIKVSLLVSWAVVSGTWMRGPPLWPPRPPHPRFALCASITSSSAQKHDPVFVLPPHYWHSEGSILMGWWRGQTDSNPETDELLYTTLRLQLCGRWCSSARAEKKPSDMKMIYCTWMHHHLLKESEPRFHNRHKY